MTSVLNNSNPPARREVHTALGEPRPKRRFYYPYHPETYSPGTDHPPLKDGEVEVFEDLFSLPETRVDVFEGSVLVESYVLPPRYAENQKNLSLRSLLTGLPSCWCKWPNDYFGDKGRGPFTSMKKAKELGPIRRTMRFDADGKRV